MKVAVLGAGAWGTALAIVSARGGNDVVIWSHTGAVAEFPAGGAVLPNNILVTREMSDIADADAWLIATPSGFIRETIPKFQNLWSGQNVIICTKGMEHAKHKFMSEILDELMPDVGAAGKLGVLSGPQYAGEVVAGEPTGSTLAGPDAVFSAGRGALPGLILESTPDIIGACVCGVGKNAVAITMGYLTGKGAGENERALKLTMGWQEIIEFGLALGAHERTFSMLCGLGDLYLTATSKTSRNFSAGLKLARGESLGDATVEGIAAIRGLSVRARELGIDLPILGAMVARLDA
ncbi:MAG: hypothetical protein FWC61_01000 [Proteobacteria bacterium]|nr:hypothetical protein [Pseudomonadota bacterium]